MILLRTAGAVAPPHTIALFGAGLVGSALVERLRTVEGMTAERLAFDWERSEARAKQLEQIEARIEWCRGPAAEGRLTLVWSAGRAGFGAGPAETASELDDFRRVLALGVRCAGSSRDGKTRIVHFSSAGGLFEGQRQVDARSVPEPRRPYGALKAAEEDLLASAGIPSLIVRLSTVYGHVRSGHRAGLISTLLANGIRRAVSSIFGAMSTLRDFIWAADVADFVSRLILSHSAWENDRTILLASGRPSSIYEVQKIIEDLLGYKIFISHAPEAFNRDDITFARSALPSGWVSSDLRTNVGAMYREAIRGGYAWRRSTVRPS